MITLSSEETSISKNTIQETIKKTRRLMDTSKGLMHVSFGVWSLLCASYSASGLYDKNIPMPIFIVWLIGQTIIMAFFNIRYKKSQVAKNLPTVTESNPFKKHPYFFYAGILAGLGVFVLALDDNNIPFENGLFLFCIAVPFVILPLVIRGYTLGLWQHYLSAFGLLCAFGSLALSKEILPPLMFLISVGISQIIVGYFFNKSWKELEKKIV